MERRKLQAETFYGFIVITPGNNSMDFIKWIPNIQVTLGNHTLTDNYQVPKIRFKNSEGKPILLRGMHTYPNQVVSSHNMRTILRHGDIEWADECLITSPKTHLKIFNNPKDIDKLLSKYEKVFRDLPLGRPPDRVV